MAITWGSWRAGGGNNYRVGVDLTYSPANPTPATTSVTVTAKLYMQSEWASNGGSDSWWLTSNQGINNSNVGGWAWTTSAMQQLLVTTETEVVPLSYTSTKTYTVTGRLKDLGASSLDISVSKTSTIPKRPVNAPAAPSDLAVARVSDARQNLSWANHPTSTAPYDSIEIQRNTYRNGVWEGWALVASVSGSSTSYADTSTASPRNYRYAIRAVNGAGKSAFHYGDGVGGERGSSNFVATTPTISGAPSAAKNASSDVVVTRSALSSGADGWDVQDSPDGVSWTTVATNVPASQTTWVHTSPSGAVTHRYRIRARSSWQSSFVVSQYSGASNVVQVLTPPLAPNGLGPTVLDATETNTLVWNHNSVDTTPQSAYELQYRDWLSGDPWTTTGKTTSPLSQHVITAGTWTNDTPVEWQVRTWGAHADPSGWSTTKFTNPNARPVVGIIIPSGSHNSDRLTVQWSYHDTESTAQSRWEAILLDDALNHVETRTGTGTKTSTTFNTRLPDGTTWTVEVTAWDGSSLASVPAEETFTVTWAKPPEPTGEATWHPADGYVSLTVDAPDPAGTEVAVDHLQVWRAQGAEWTLVADNLTPGQSLVDMIPPTGGVAVYRVAAISALPSTAWSTDIAVATDTKWLFLNYGPGFGQVVRVWGDLSASRGAGREKALHQFANRPLPVERSGVARSRTYSLSAKLFAPFLAPDASSTWEEIEDLADAPAPVLLRDPQGVRLFCSVGEPSLSDHLQPHPTVSIPLTVVDWSEAVEDDQPPVSVPL